jgi:hypothetical protein
VSGRLDDEKLETGRRWGAGLGADGRDELRAAGKAILILIEEIERLQVDVWHMRDRARAQIAPVSEREPEVAGAPARPPPPREKLSLEEVAEEFLTGAPDQEGLEPTLRDRLRRLLPARAVKIE